MDPRNRAPQVVRFGVFELDTLSGELHRNGLRIRLPDQSFQILRLLLSRPGEVVTREELRNALWTSETFVDFDVGLNSAIRKLREALDDSPENARFIETLPRRGYRFIAPVSPPAVETAIALLEARLPRRMDCGRLAADRDVELHPDAPAADRVRYRGCRRPSAGGIRNQPASDAGPSTPRPKTPT